MGCPHRVGSVSSLTVASARCLSQEYGEAAGPAPKVDDGCRRGRHQGQQQLCPRRANGRVEQAVVGLLVEYHRLPNQ